MSLHNQILITTGGSEAIMFGFLTCLNPGDEVIIPRTLLCQLQWLCRAGRRECGTYSFRIETGFALPPIEDFEKVITPKTKAIIICSPNNPTGYLYSRAEMEKLKAICLKHNLYFFRMKLTGSSVMTGNM